MINMIKLHSALCTLHSFQFPNAYCPKPNPSYPLTAPTMTPFTKYFCRKG